MQKIQHPLGFRAALPMILLVIPYLYLIFIDPFEEPVQTILEVLSLGVLLGITILHLVRSWREADEVQLAAARFSVATGAVLGLVSAMGFVVIMRHTPSLAEFIASVAGFSRNELPSAAVGFALGTMTTLILVVISGYIAYAVWLWRMARGDKR